MTGSQGTGFRYQAIANDIIAKVVRQFVTGDGGNGVALDILWQRRRLAPIAGTVMTMPIFLAHVTVPQICHALAADLANPGERFTIMVQGQEVIDPLATSLQHY